MIAKKYQNITCSLTFHDNSIHIVRSITNNNNTSELMYDEYWFTSETIKPHKIITGEYFIILNGKQLEFDQQPIMCNDRILVPLRKIFEELGANVNYNSYIDTSPGHFNAEEIEITATSKLWLSRRWFGA